MVHINSVIMSDQAKDAEKQQRQAMVYICADGDEVHILDKVMYRYFSSSSHFAVPTNVPTCWCGLRSLPAFSSARAGNGLAASETAVSHVAHECIMPARPCELPASRGGGRAILRIASFQEVSFPQLMFGNAAQCRDRGRERKRRRISGAMNTEGTRQLGCTADIGEKEAAADAVALLFWKECRVWMNKVPVVTHRPEGKQCRPLCIQPGGVGSSGSSTCSSEAGGAGPTTPKRIKIFAGGFESNEEYTYVRGRASGGGGDASSDTGSAPERSTSLQGEEDLRYRHKKFKKMATTVTAEEQNAQQVVTVTSVVTSATSEGESSSGKSSPSPSVNGTVAGGRYVCPYCKMACAKPSVLEKHIRAHTNERPYPCVPCGFAFKTKSNLYKHCRSRAHAMKAMGRDETGRPLAPGQMQPQQQTPSEVSDPEDDLDEGSPLCPTPETPPLSTPHFLNSSPGAAYSPPLTEKQQRPGIYKPKFHTALYNDSSDVSELEGESKGGVASPEVLHRMHVERRISKIISDNQAIVETMEPLWPRKYTQQRSREEDPEQWPKRVVRQMSAGACFSSQENHRETPPPSVSQQQAAVNSRLALALLRPKQQEEVHMTLQGGATVTLETKEPAFQQPLNLSVNNQDSRKRCLSESVTAAPDVRELLVNWSQQSPHKLARFMSVQDDKSYQHPQNPEGSIIKDLLLKARGGLDVSELLLNSAEGMYEDTFSCNICKISYRNAENLEIHQRYYCKGSDLPPHKANKAPLSPRGAVVNRKQHRSSEEAKMAAAVELVALSTPPPFPSPGPLLGSTPLVGGYNSRASKEDSPPLKKRRLHSMSEERPPSTGSLRSLEELSRSPHHHGRPNSLQMFGGKVHINDGSEPKTMIIDTGRNVPPSMLSIPGMSGEDASGDKGDRKSPSNIVVTIARSKLNSGGTIVQKSSHSSSTCSTTYSVSSICTSSLVPDQQLLAAVSRPIVPNITTPSLAPSLHHHPFLASQMSKLTSAFSLPMPPAPRTPQQTPSSDPGVVTILHGGREIPYVPGMPGPQSLCGPEHQQQPRPLDLVCSPTAGTPSRTSLPELPPKWTDLGDDYELRPPQPSVLLLPPTTTTTTPPKASSSSHSEPKSPPPNNRPPVIKLEEPEQQTSSELGKKFLRPTSLPLKPGTFAVKKPMASGPCSLVSPETPRPRKSYGQLYLNGHAYTYLGLKCSTRVFFCCLNRPQPMYVPQSTDPRLSMYSNWKVCAPSSEPATELVGTPGRAMGLYDSRHRPAGYTVARSRQQLPLVITHSSQWRQGPPVVKSTVEPILNFYCRGRYVCEECGIRCKKPSMLKKHIRTHTDVRPFTCKHCSFSFKTKGNLTKHMKSKAHYKKCVELGIVPVPTIVDDSYIDEESLAKQQALRSARGENGAPSDSDSESEDLTEDEEDDEDEELMLLAENGDSGRVEREAACSLLSLSEQHAGLIPVAARPSTYPYTYGPPAAASSMVTPHTPTIVGPVSAHSEREKVSRNTRLAGGGGTSRPATSAASAAGSSRYYFPSRRESCASPVHEDPGGTPPPMDLSRSSVPVVTPVTPVPDSAALLAALCSTVERLPQKLPSTAMESAAETTMLQAYLTERALQDVRKKQHQVQHRWNHAGGSAATTPTTPTTPLVPPQSPLWTPALVPPSPVPIKRLSPAEVTARPVACKPEVKVIVEQETPVPRSAVQDSRKHAAAAAAAAAVAAGGSPPVTEDGKSICVICNKVFSKPSQLRLHVNIHYFERPFRCDSCAVSFRTKGHLQKHERSVSHQNKVSMNSTFGMPTTDNPRPFKCEDCKIAFRIHGHLAKHLRSKMHIMKLECLGKLPFGTYAEMERSGVNLNEIDTTDCDNSLESLQVLAQKMYEKDPSKLQQWDPRRQRTTSESSADDLDDMAGEPYAGSRNSMHGGGISEAGNRPLLSGSDYDDASDGETEMERRLSCPRCDQCFQTLSSLEMHMYMEHNNSAAESRPPPAPSPPPAPMLLPQPPAEEFHFRCDVCGLILHSSDAHKKHMSSHTQLRPFVCEFCDAGFTSKSLLLGHLALHQPPASSVHHNSRASPTVAAAAANCSL
ncbi:hypothetical protein B566_EDAN004555 [Ephemera danica]|nr:hypothetical protein B566_EDAN004555 [Ephemera danica]